MAMKFGYAFLFIILSLFFQSLAAVFTKLAALKMNGMSAHGVLASPYYLLAIACLGLQAVCWPLALRRFPLFWAYLFMSGIYVIIPPISRFIFHEAVSPWNYAGALIIMAGLAVMVMNGRGGRNA